MRHTLLHIAIIASALAALAACAPMLEGQRELGEVDGVPFYELRAERQPDLTAPRGGSHFMLLNGEPTLLGGITDAFVLEPSIEYYSDGKWNKVPMKYPHYYGFTTLLPDGKAMLGGGCAENFGIGQSWGVEVYDPATHSTTALGIMDRKRAGVSALALADGEVLISGNWLAADAIEHYVPGKGFSQIKEAATPRAYPYILQSAPDNVLIFSGSSAYGGPAEPLVDRLHGEPFSEPLMEEWDMHPYPLSPCSGDELCIGEYTYLIPALAHSDGHLTIIKLSGEQFSLLEMDHPFPNAAPDGESLTWCAYLQVDRSGRKAWVMGFGADGGYYLGCVDYDATLDGGKASLSVYKVDTPDSQPFFGQPLLLSGGRLLLAGGTGMDPGLDQSKGSYFHCGSQAWMLYTDPATAAARQSWGWWLAGGILLAGLIAAAGLILKRKRKIAAEAQPEDDSTLRADMMEQMLELIGEKKLFLRKDLHLEDIAQELATNKTYISLLVNNLSGTKFTDLVNGLRISHAQQLMLEHPDMLLADVADASGFSSRSAFFRNFKAQTGMTPMEWLESQKAAKGR